MNIWFEIKFMAMWSWNDKILVYLWVVSWNRLLSFELHSSMWNCHFLFETRKVWVPFIFCIRCRWHAQLFGLQWHDPVSKEERESYESRKSDELSRTSPYNLLKEVNSGGIVKFNCRVAQVEAGPLTPKSILFCLKSSLVVLRTPLFWTLTTYSFQRTS